MFSVFRLVSGSFNRWLAFVPLIEGITYNLACVFMLSLTWKKLPAFISFQLFFLQSLFISIHLSHPIGVLHSLNLDRLHPFCVKSADLIAANHFLKMRWPGNVPPTGVFLHLLEVPLLEATTGSNGTSNAQTSSYFPLLFLEKSSPACTKSLSG